MRQSVQSSRARRDRGTGVLQALARRMRLAASSALRWSLEGFVDDDGTVEAEEAEVFPGFGFLARPKSGDDAEVIVLKVGGASGHPVIIATRNHDGIKRIGTLGADETVIFNSTTLVKVTAAGEVQVGAIGGPFAALATKADIDALTSWVTAHVHIVPGATGGGGGLTSSTATPVPPIAAGTQKLKAQ